jgi:hypothetical protein
LTLVIQPHSTQALAATALSSGKIVPYARLSDCACVNFSHCTLSEFVKPILYKLPKVGYNVGGFKRKAKEGEL